MGAGGGRCSTFFKAIDKFMEEDVAGIVTQVTADPQ